MLSFITKYEAKGEGVVRFTSVGKWLRVKEGEHFGFASSISQLFTS
jgi:hypothetical protein